MDRRWIAVALVGAGVLLISRLASAAPPPPAPDPYGLTPQEAGHDPYIYTSEGRRALWEAQRAELIRNAPPAAPPDPPGGWPATPLW
jgi:hypothetical protein